MISNDEFKAIYELDLDPIKCKLMHEESGEGWSLEKATAVEFEYRRFLVLMKMFPTEQTAPLYDVDTFWHYHILDTQKYAVDCEDIFGYFLHHFPYIGMRGKEDEEAHHRVGERMRELYEETFGESYLRMEPAPQQAQTAMSGVAIQTAMSGVAAQTAMSGVAVKTAMSGVTAKTAMSGVAVKTAMSGVAAKTAMSGVAVKTAMSGVAAKTAMSGVAVKTAMSGVASKTAMSGVAVKTAMSGVASKTAMSGVAANTAMSGVATKTAMSGVATTKRLSASQIKAKQQQDLETARFYSERPVLAHA